MLPQILSPHLNIPKYISSSHLVSRTKLGSPPYFINLDISNLVSATISPAHSPDTVDDDFSSSHSPPASSANYHYDQRGSTDMYDHPPPPHSFKSISSPVNSSAVMNKSDSVSHYLSDSTPSPVDVHPTSPHFLHHPHPVPGSYRPPDERFNPHPRDEIFDYSAPDDSRNSLLGHRRMSESAIISGANTYVPQSNDVEHPNRLQPFNFNPPTLNPPRPSYLPSLHRGTSIGSLRDARHSQYEPSPSTHHSRWKDDEPHHQAFSHHHDALDPPISPMQPNFTGGLGSPTSGLQFSSGAENYYGPSPPNTGTSTSSAPVISSSHRTLSHISHDIERSPLDPNSKTYSFVALPGNAVKKRPRRRYDEIERLYHCSWPDCNKAYGTLNHLNAHVTMQKHGAKRSPNGMPSSSSIFGRIFFRGPSSDFSRGQCHRLTCNILRIQRAAKTVAESQKGS
jgi:hypothetical protein